MSGAYNFVNFGEGAGAASMAEVNELNKALSAGTGYSGAPTALSGGGVLQVESLDASLKSVTYEMKAIKLWPQMPKDQAYNTIEEYNRIDAYGDQGKGFISEGALPRSEDSHYSRQIQRVRFIGVTRELTHVYTLVRNAHGDAIAAQIRNGTVRILEIVERNLFDGHGWYASSTGLFDGADAALLPEADLAWDGLDKQIRKGNSDSTAKASAFTGFGNDEDVIKDMRGLVLDEDALEDGSRVVAENFGTVSLHMLDTRAHSDLAKQFYPKERVNPMGVANGKAGFVLQSFVASSGEFALQSNVFLRPKRGAPAPLADAPAAPVITSATVVAPTVSGSAFAAADAGTYSYKATAINGNGEGAQGAAVASLAVAAGGAIDVLVAATAGAIAYGLYRAPKGASSGWEFVGYVAPASVGAAATFRDLNVRLPGLAQSYMLSMDNECLRFKQLAPLMKMDLAIVATAYRWMQLLYGTPIVYTPRKHFIHMNIGRSA